MVLCVLRTVNVPLEPVQDQTVVVVKENLLGVLIVIQTAIVPVVAPIIINLVFNVLRAVVVKQVQLVPQRLHLV